MKWVQPVAVDVSSFAHFLTGAQLDRSRPRSSAGIWAALLSQRMILSTSKAHCGSDFGAPDEQDTPPSVAVTVRTCAQRYDEVINDVGFSIAGSYKEGQWCDDTRIRPSDGLTNKGLASQPATADIVDHQNGSRIGAFGAPMTFAKASREYSPPK